MEKFWVNDLGVLYRGDAHDIGSVLDYNSVDMCITSPPYWALRKYSDNEHELGQENSLYNYVDHLAFIFDEIYPVIKEEGSLWVVMGDTFYGGNKGSGGKTEKQITNPGSYFNHSNYMRNSVEGHSFSRLKELPNKSLCNIPARFSIAMQDRGWLLRNTIIWHKPNNFVTSAKDRFTVDFEYIYWFVKISRGYYFKQQFEPYTTKMNRWGGEILKANGESEWDKDTGQPAYRNRNMRPNKKGRNMRTVWSINTQAVHGFKNHAKYPEKLLEIPIKATCPEDGIVLDPFMGSGTTAVVAERHNRKWIGIEISEEYCKDIVRRVGG